MNALELTHVYKQYGDFAIRDLNLTLPQGSIMGLVGENGAGKSTTIRMILNMVKPDSGEIAVLGKTAGDDFNAVKEDIGVVLDEPAFTNCLNARHVNKIMGMMFRNWDARCFRDYLDRFSLPEKKQVKEYSRGMKMKLSIAVALSHHPKLLLLDEATSGLDPVVRDDILDIFFEFTRDETHSILMSSHIVSDLEKVCDYVAFLHRGSLVECAEKDVLLEKYGLVHGTREQLAEFGDLLRGKRETPYGMEGVVERTGIPAGIPVQAVGLEELFVYLTKEER